MTRLWSSAFVLSRQSSMKLRTWGRDLARMDMPLRWQAQSSRILAIGYNSLWSTTRGTSTSKTPLSMKVAESWS